MNDNIELKNYQNITDVSILHKLISYLIHALARYNNKIQSLERKIKHLLSSESKDSSLSQYSRSHSANSINTNLQVEDFYDKDIETYIDLIKSKNSKSIQITRSPYIKQSLKTLRPANSTKSFRSLSHNNVKSTKLTYYISCNVLSKGNLNKKEINNSLLQTIKTQKTQKNEMGIKKANTRKELNNNGLIILRKNNNVQMRTNRIKITPHSKTNRNNNSKRVVAKSVNIKPRYKKKKIEDVSFITNDLKMISFQKNNKEEIEKNNDEEEEFKTKYDLIDKDNTKTIYMKKKPQKYYDINALNSFLS